MNLKGTARRAKITDIPHANSKWNKAEIGAIMDDIRINRITRKMAAEKYGINYELLLRKIDAYNHGELK